MENFYSIEDCTVFDGAQLPDGVSAFKQADDVRLSTDNMYATVSPQSSAEFHSPNSAFEFNNEELHKAQTKTILKKRVEDNLKEAEAHLQRVNSRKVTHRFDSQLLDESPTGQEFS